MKNPFQTIPFLRITLALAVGIIVAGKINLATDYFLGFILLLLTTLHIANRKYEFHLELLVGWLITLTFILFGIVFAQNNNLKPHFYTEGKFSGVVLETPEEKENSYKTIIQLNGYFENDSVLGCNEKVLTYLEKSDRVRLLKPGDVILMDAKPKPVKNNGNPFEFDYKTYLERQKIYRQMYLATTSWAETNLHKLSFSVLAELTRDRLLNVYRAQDLGEEETEILSALTLGYKRGLDPETKRVFSSAGAMHVLAVSGLHVGILYMVFTFLFGFLRKSRKGKFIFVVVSLLVLWGYAFLTGLSPSVMRAATMFSLVCIGANIQRRPNIYNSLAFAAFFLLLINPGNLYEVGFQLSFAAVFGIVFLQPKLARIIPANNRILKPFWILLTVSVAAQLATFPLTSYYFNQFPSYFWLSNLLVIPVAFLLIFLGIGLLVFSYVPLLASVIGFLTKWIIHFTFLFLKEIENLPFSVVEIGISSTQSILIGLSLAFTFLFLANGRSLNLKTSLFILLAFAGLTFYSKTKQLTTRELIAYNHPDNPVLHFINGSHNYVVSEFPIETHDFIYREIFTVKTKKHLESPTFLTICESFENEDLFLKNGIVNFSGIILQFEKSGFTQPKIQNTSFIVSRKSGFSDLNRNWENAQIISFTKFPSEPTDTNVYFVSRLGAFQSLFQRK